jgi:hypothetical protein
MVFLLTPSMNDASITIWAVCLTLWFVVTGRAERVIRVIRKEKVEKAEKTDSPYPDPPGIV